MNQTVDKDLLTLTDIESKSMNRYKITIRGSRNKDDIYFNLAECVSVFRIQFKHITHSRNVIWIITQNGKERFITYQDLIDQERYNLNNESLCAYIELVNNLLYSDNHSSCSDIEDDISLKNCLHDHTEEIHHYMLMTYQHKIELLNQIIETKNKELLVKDKEIEILNMHNTLNIKEKNNIIRDLLKEIDAMQSYKSEWI